MLVCHNLGGAYKITLHFRRVEGIRYKIGKGLLNLLLLCSLFSFQFAQTLAFLPDVFGIFRLRRFFFRLRSVIFYRIHFTLKQMPVFIKQIARAFVQRRCIIEKIFSLNGDFGINFLFQNLYFFFKCIKIPDYFGHPDNLRTITGLFKLTKRACGKR